MLRKDIIQKGLEERASGATLGNIEKILEGISTLSPVEKLLLYLKLPTHNSPAVSVDPTSADSSKSLSANNFAVNWIKSHLEENTETSLSKQRVYDEYRSFCMSCNQSYINTPEFGRLLRTVFPNVKPRRLGKRGCARYVYGGVGYIHSTQLNELPVIQASSSNSESAALGDCIKDEFNDEEADDDRKEEMIRKSAIALVMEWSCKLLVREFDDIHQLAQHLVVNGYVGSHSADAYTVLATSPLDDLTGSKLIIQAPVAGVSGPKAEPSLTDETAQKRQETKNSLLKAIQKRSDIRTQKSRMEASRTAVCQGALTKEPSDALSGRKASDLIISPLSRAEIKRKVTPTPKTILPKLACYNTSQSTGVFQNSDSQVSSLGNGMQSTQFVILSPPTENGNITTVSAAGNNTPSLFLISSPIANQHIVDSKTVVQNGSISEYNIHPLQSPNTVGITGLSNSNVNATCHTNTITTNSATLISTKAQNLSKLFSITGNEVECNSNTTGDSIAAILQNKLSTNLSAATTLSGPYTSLNTKGLKSVQTRADVSMQNNSNIILTRNSGLQLKVDTTLRPNNYNGIVFSNDISMPAESSKSATVISSTPSPAVNLNTRNSQVDSALCSINQPSLAEVTGEQTGKELGTRSRTKSRSVSATKVRSPNKTVLSLLREVKGGMCNGDEGKKFQNDNRPVSELLKESRREKQIQPPSKADSGAAKLMELFQKRVTNGIGDDSGSTKSLVTLSSGINIPQSVTIMNNSNVLNSVSSLQGVNMCSSIPGNINVTKPYNKTVADVVKNANSSGNISLSTLQLLATANSNNGIEPGNIIIALPNSQVSGISGIQIPVSKANSVNQNILSLGNRMPVKFSGSNEQLEKLLLNNLSVEKLPENFVVSQNTINTEGVANNTLKNQRSAELQRRIHPQLLQGSSNIRQAPITDAQKISVTVGSQVLGGSQLARLLSVKDEDQSANLAANLNNREIRNADSLGKRVFSGAEEGSSKRQCVDFDALGLKQNIGSDTAGSRQNIGILQGLLHETSRDVSLSASNVNNCELLGSGNSADISDISTYMNSSVKNFTLQQLLENKSGAALARIKIQDQVKQQQLLQQQQQQRLQQFQQRGLQQKQQQEMKQLLQERLNSQELQQVLQVDHLSENDLKQLLARLQQPQATAKPVDSAFRPASALLEQLSGACVKSPAVYLSHSARPSTVAAFTFDDIPLDSSMLTTSSLLCDSESRDSDSSTPMSALLSPHTGNFTPLQLYDSFPMTGTVKPMAKVAPPSSQLSANVSAGTSGSFVPSQKSCFAPLSGQMGINLHSVPVRSQRNQSGLNKLPVAAKDLLNLISLSNNPSNVVVGSSRNQTNDLQNQGFAPVSSILPLKRVRTGVDKIGAGAAVRGRQRHRSAQEIHGTEGAAQIESIARMLQSSCDEIKQQGNPAFLNRNPVRQSQANNPVEWVRQLSNCISPFSSELAEINQSENVSMNEDVATLLHRSLSEPSAQALLAASQNPTDPYFIDSLTDQNNQEPTNLGSTLFVGDQAPQVSLVRNSRLPGGDRGLCGGYQGSGRHSRGDHMISGATLNPEFSMDSTDFVVGLTPAMRPEGLRVTSTPPSSQNSSPAFGVEMMDHRTCYIIEPTDDSTGMNVDVSGVSLDTPNSIEANTSSEFDRLLLNMCDDGDWPSNVS